METLSFYQLEHIKFMKMMGLLDQMHTMLFSTLVLIEHVMMGLVIIMI